VTGEGKAAMGLFGSSGRWEGYFSCPLTPYDADGRVDVEVYAAQVEFLLGQGAPALCALMHLAESLNLTDEERRLIARTTTEVVDGRIPVVVHASCPGTDQTVALARHAESVGAQAVVVASPYYWRPGDAAQLQHFATVGDAMSVRNARTRGSARSRRRHANA